MIAALRQRFARHGWLVAIAVAYLYVFPYFPRIQSANELPRVYLVRAIVDDQTFAIDRGVHDFGATADVSPSHGHQYSNKAPGSSFVAVPFYALWKWTLGEPSLAQSMWICRFAAGIVPAIAFLALLASFLARMNLDPDARRLALVAYALGSMAMTYALLYYSHQLSAVCVGAAWILATDVVEERRGWVAMLAAGALAGAAPLVDYQAAFACVPVAIFVLARALRWPLGVAARRLAPAIAGAAVPIAILLAYHAACFGSPWRTGYDASQTFAGFHQHGFLGLTRPHADALWGSLAAPDNGLVTLAPWLLLAIPGGIALWRRGQRGLVATAGSVAVVMVLFVSSINFWRGGWGVGPRYITVMLPFLVPLAAAGFGVLRARPLALGAACGTVVVGVVVYAGSAATFPYWPDSLRVPLYEVTVRLLGDGAVAPNVANTCGLYGLLSIAPYVAAVAGLVGWAIARAAGWRGLGLAVVVGALLIGALGLVPHGGEHADRAYVQTIRPALPPAW
ncbi:MAG TPA: hypothetical protein VGF94_00710 [Kofleriaceae bacterium]